MRKTPSSSSVKGRFDPPGDKCGLGHACGFCPQELGCPLDKDAHNSELIAHRLAGIGTIIMVVANKGGVGKSTVAANLAVALGTKGVRTGLADADVHGPNAPRIFGLQDLRVKVSAQGLGTGCYDSGDIDVPVKIGSLGFLLPESDTPVVWRDAYKHDYIHHMIGSFDWGPLDILVIDMPPGTGNELITLTDMLEGQNLHALLVSSADAIVLQDTLKAARFCRERGVPILGLVENYAGTVCPHCGGEVELFPRAAEVKTFEEQDIKTLARVPFMAEVAEGAAAGRPAAGKTGSLAAELFGVVADACWKTALDEAGGEMLEDIVALVGEADVTLAMETPVGSCDVSADDIKGLLKAERERLNSGALADTGISGE